MQPVNLVGARRTVAAAFLLLLTLLLTACGASDTSTRGAADASTGDASPRDASTDGAGVRPERIVSLSATATEILFAIGAGDEVVAVDEYSTYPPEAPVTDLSGLDPSIEAITAYDPDLVVVSFDPGDLVAGLDAVGVTTIVQDAAATLDDTYDQIAQLGVATGHRTEAADLVDEMQAQLEEIVAALPEEAKGLTYYHELDPTYFTATSSTFIGSVYALLGLENIADTADGAESGYPQLSAEYIIEADPDLIFLADTKCCDATAESVAQRPGWETISAVTNGGVVELDDDVASRWGPRIMDYLRAVADGVTELVTG